MMNGPGMGGQGGPPPYGQPQQMGMGPPNMNNVYKILILYYFI